MGRAEPVDPIRTSLKRCARLSLSYSKRLRNETLRCTPAMALGVMDHIWTVGELVKAALDARVPPTIPPREQLPLQGVTAAQAKNEKRGSYRGPRGPRLRVIKGGRA